MHSPRANTQDDDILNQGTRIDGVLKVIHHHYVPPFDLETCEILDSILQHATTDQIAHFSQLHPDTVRRMMHMIESVLTTSSHSQIIDNCQKRLWSSQIYRQITHESHTFE
jgi:hypothetical protein